MTSQVRNLWCRSQNKMGPSSKYVSSRHIVDLRQPQVAMKHRLHSVKNTCVAQSLEFRPLQIDIERVFCIKWVCGPEIFWLVRFLEVRAGSGPLFKIPRSSTVLLPLSLFTQRFGWGLTPPPHSSGPYL